MAPDIYCPAVETFGQKLRLAVERKGLRLDEVAKATGLVIEHLQALERDDFGALPGDDTLIEGLRSFARLAHVNPDQVIADYRLERQRWLAAVPAEVGAVRGHDAGQEPKSFVWPPRPAESQIAAERPRPGLGRAAGVAILASAILVFALAFLFWPRSSPAPETGLMAVAQDTVPMAKTQETPKALEPSGIAVSPKDTPSRPISALEPSTDASRLSIREHGVGRGVVGHDLAGEAEQFAEGERVWFWTRVEGGSTGAWIDHVWIRDGDEALRVPLQLGGSSWRTRSYKDLNPGSEGNWAVEARDEAGRVLARQEFRCSPRQ